MTDAPTWQPSTSECICAGVSDMSGNGGVCEAMSDLRFWCYVEKPCPGSVPAEASSFSGDTLYHTAYFADEEACTGVTYAPTDRPSRSPTRMPTASPTRAPTNHGAFDNKVFLDLVDRVSTLESETYTREDAEAKFATIADTYSREDAEAKFATIADLSDYALAADLSDYALATTLSDYALADDLSEYALASDLSAYALASDLSAYALASDLSAYALASDLSSHDHDDMYYTEPEINAIMFTNSIPTYNSVYYNGYYYAVMDGTHKHITVHSCQNYFIALPEGWVVAPYDYYVQVNVAYSGSSGTFGWGTHCVVYANGSSYTTYTSSPSSCSTNQLISDPNDESLKKVRGCYRKVLMRRPA